MIADEGLIYLEDLDTVLGENETVVSAVTENDPTRYNCNYYRLDQ